MNTWALRLPEEHEAAPLPASAPPSSKGGSGMAVLPHRLPRGSEETHASHSAQAGPLGGRESFGSHCPLEQRQQSTITAGDNVYLRSEEVKGLVQSHTVGLCTPRKLELWTSDQSRGRPLEAPEIRPIPKALAKTGRGLAHRVSREDCGFIRTWLRWFFFYSGSFGFMLPACRTHGCQAWSPWGEGSLYCQEF